MLVLNVRVLALYKQGGYILMRTLPKHGLFQTLISDHSALASTDEHWIIVWLLPLYVLFYCVV